MLKHLPAVEVHYPGKTITTAKTSVATLCENFHIPPEQHRFQYRPSKTELTQEDLSMVHKTVYSSKHGGFGMRKNNLIRKPTLFNFKHKGSIE
jgi:hypothetical protein